MVDKRDDDYGGNLEIACVWHPHSQSGQRRDFIVGYSISNRKDRFSALNHDHGEILRIWDNRN